MNDFSISYQSKSEARTLLEQYFAQLPEKGRIKVTVEKNNPEAADLTNLWEEMGSATGSLIGRFIGVSSEAAALGMQALFLEGQQLMAPVRNVTTAQPAGPTPDEHRERQPDP